MSAPGKLLIVDDEEMYRKLLLSRLKRKNYDLLEAADGDQAIKIAQRNNIDVALLDVKMPGMNGIEALEKLKEIDPNIEVLILTGQGNIDTAISAMKAGAYDYLSKPYKLSELDLMVSRALEKRRLALRCAGLAAEVNHLRGRRDSEIIGVSKAWRRMAALIKKAAPLDIPVLITGESGVGKEIVADALHKLSPRRKNAFVPLNCASLQENLLESELFGHKRGAFTGASSDKEGLFQTASEGSLFLDEIGELLPQSQAKLLRVLETGEFRPLGGTALKHTNTRIIAATNRDLENRVAANEFRQDLYYRLNVLHIHVAPLRERKDDIPLLAQHFLKRSAGGDVGAFEIKPEALDILSAYSWPGNIRELRNVMERFVAMNGIAPLEARHLSALLGGTTNPDQLALGTNEIGSGFERVMPMAEMQKTYVDWTLRQCANNVSDAARRLGISRSKIYRLMKGEEL
jgi:DNA-binding NtrC family response regulator